MVDSNQNVSVMVVGIGYHGDDNLIILDENLNAQNYVKHRQKTFSILHKTCLATEIIHACFNMTVLQSTQLSNCHMVGAAGNIHQAMAIPVPDPQYKRTSLRFYGQRDRESHACHKKWSDSSFAQSLAEHHCAIFAQSLQPPPQKSKGSY